MCIRREAAAGNLTLGRGLRVESHVRGSAAHATLKRPDWNPEAGTVTAALAAEGGLDRLIGRQIAERSLLVALLRRFMRVSSLHVVDAAVVGTVAVGLSSAVAPFASSRPFAPAIVAIFLLSLNALGAYHPGDARRDEHRLLSGTGVALLIIGCLTVFPPLLPLSPVYLVALALSAFLSLAVARKGVDLLVRQAYARGIGHRRALMVGSLEEVGEALLALRTRGNVDQFVLGHVAPDGDDDPAALGAISDLPWLVEREDVQEVIVVTPLPRRQLTSLAELCLGRGAKVFVMPVVGGLRAEPARVADGALLRLHPATFELRALLVKRVFDLVGAALLLLVTAPLMAAIALAVRIDTPGPVFFRQERVGLGGRRFRIWKFRSMSAGAERERDRLLEQNAYGDSRLFKLHDDPRITRVGRFLRRSSLDELPQLFNVFRGEMSLVGPRPPLPCEVAQYEPHHFARLAAVPGITGPWQVGGRNLITDFETVVRLERSYIDSWSLLLDIKILVKTIQVVVLGKGAY
jgi:exopolysaccharide biosynthesis polyprenyl glycosylphosphotransferase